METLNQFKEHQTPTAPEYEYYINIMDNQIKHPVVNFSVSIVSMVPFSLSQLIILYSILFKYLL